MTTTTDQIVRAYEEKTNTALRIATNILNVIPEEEE